MFETNSYKKTDDNMIKNQFELTMDREGLNQNMIQYLEGIPIEEKTNGLDETLSCLQENVNFIRHHLEKKPKKLSMKKLDKKLDLILDILKKNGFTHDE